MPIASSFLLSSKAGKEAWVEAIVDKAAKSISYRIRKGGTKEEIAAAKLGTSAGKRQAFRCILSDAAIPYDDIRKAGKTGEMGQTLIAIVAEGIRSRVYVAPSKDHERVAHSSKPNWKPEALLPDNTRDFKTPNYGLRTFGDLFTDRQLVALNTFSDLVHEARAEIEGDALAAGLSDDPAPLRDGGTGAKAYAEAVSVYLGFAVDKIADRNSEISTWATSRQHARNTFGRQAIPMTWDFAESNVFSKSSGSFSGGIKSINDALRIIPTDSQGKSFQAAAGSGNLNGYILSTDPPYYDNIGYADLSDFFYVWMRHTTHLVDPDLFGVLASPKSEELVAMPYRHGSKEAAESFFLDGMSKAIASMARQSSPDYPATILLRLQAKRD